METPWEEVVNRQKERDQEELIQAQEAIAEKLQGKKAPHLTNLNEDIQLSGKLYYSLANIATEQFTIGRAEGNQVVLRGVGI
mgnify:CR=1 FL=1